MKNDNIENYIANITMLILTTIISGFVFSKLWSWFMVPIFDLQPIRIVEAIGLLTIIGYLKMEIKNTEENTTNIEQTVKLLLTSILVSVFVLFYGWIITLFM